MKLVSTRHGETASLDEALVRGLAGDGGLYLPERLPQYDARDFDGADTLAETASVLLRPFFAGSRLAGELDAIVGETFSFPVPLRELPVTPGRAWLLELFHGPTAAFKDVGARFLAACLSRLERGAATPLTVLVATSGDTGGAVAAAFAGQEGVRVAVLFPEGRVSERQRRQLTGWGGNVLSLAVAGSFDDCQALVKQAMNELSLARRFRFSSANSINIGRLLPQCTYYAQAALGHHRRTGRKPGFVIPTGNLGNGLACILARRMGLPIGPVVLATNANRLIPDWLEGADWAPRVSLATLASAMDVGSPSNMERLLALAGDRAAARREICACAVSDAEIERQITRDFHDFGFATCPHTATATFAWRQLGERARSDHDWIVVATAHPAKFERIVEPLIGERVPVPESLQAILARPERSVAIEPGLDSLVNALDAGWFLDGGQTTGHK
ncbi:MAG TPA: threonine synthase [Woeseiaceae bacterium]|nr:threonine synthase [Woeseiaceae bacterium]